MLKDQKKQLEQVQLSKQKHLIILKKEIEKRKQLLNPIIRQLRDHFRLMKQELAEMTGQLDPDVDAMTYEQLLALGEQIGTVSKGLSECQKKKLYRYPHSGHSVQCPICRDDMNFQDQCILLQCKHQFHEVCLLSWVQKEKVCPICKAEIQVE